MSCTAILGQGTQTLKSELCCYQGTFRWKITQNVFSEKNEQKIAAPLVPKTGFRQKN